MQTLNLRSLLDSLISRAKDFYTHKQIPSLCQQLHLVSPPNEDSGSKAERLSKSLASTPDHLLPQVAESVLQVLNVKPIDRNYLQDIVWAPGPEIPKRHRRAIADAISINELFKDEAKFDKLISSLFVIDEDDSIFDTFISGSANSLRARIQRHVFGFRGDWSVDDLFREIKAYDASDARFAKLLEGITDPDVTPDEAAQRRLVDKINPILSQCSVGLVENSNRDGYPLFAIVSTDSLNRSRPKNLIFASPVKPDLRFRDAINNDIEIVTHEDKVLVYDRPISNDGLRWCDLQDWWRELNNFDSDIEAKTSLYHRLKTALPDNSPPQLLLFSTFHRTFGSAIPQLPALLPEVWLHWDPQSVKRRGTKALIRSRMDFLMLLPNGVRVVLEVDGVQHYSNDGKPNPATYAEMVAADRQLKFDGYHVFRFGGLELQPGRGEKVVSEFFARLFERFNLR